LAIAPDLVEKAVFCLAAQEDYMMIPAALSVVPARRAHTTPEPDVPPPKPEKEPPPDEMPSPDHAPIEEPTPHRAPIQT
jgi:hypothetical protein